MPTTTTGIATEFITFSRPGATGGGATVTDSDGRIKWAPHNILLASEQFDNAVWEKTNITVTANYAVAPNGTTTADRAVYVGSLGTPATRQLRQAIAISTSGLTTTFGIWVSGTGKFRVQNVHGGVLANYSSDITATATPTLYTLTVTNAANAGNGFQVAGICAATTDDAFDLNVWGAHLYRSDMGMQANTSAYPMYNPTTPKNLLGFTEDFSNAAWSKAGLAAFGSGSIANAIVAPNGLQTADLIDADTATSSHRLIGTAVTIPSNTPCVFSVYLKAGTHSFAQIHDGASVSYFANFNLSSGAVGTATGCTATMSPVGNGWYRCSIAMTLNVANPVMCIGMVTSATSARNESWTTTGTETFYVWGAQLSDSASLDAYVANHFTAPSAAAYYGPRRDFDGSTLSAKGLLVEEQRTNLLLHSAAFDAVVWSLNSCTIAANAGTAPDGSSSADKVVSAAATASTGPAQSVTSTTVAHTFSIYAKAAGATFIQLLWNGPTSANYANFDLSLGTLTAGTYTDAKITPVGNSWYRISITSTSASTTITANAWLIDNGTAARGTSFTGDGTKGALLWGAQLEAGSFATSYIPTTSASATRNADVAQVGTAAFPYSATEGTIVANFSTFDGTSGLNRIVALTDGTNNNRTEIRNASGSEAVVVSGGAPSATLDLANITLNAVTKAGLVYKASDFAATINGAAPATASSGAVSVGVDRLNIGTSATGVSQLNGWVRQITYLPRRVTNAELQTRTTL